MFMSDIVFAQEYSLDELYSLALERSETIKIAEEDLYLSKRGKDKALAAFLPTLSAFAGHTRYSEEKGGGDFTLQPKYTNSWGLRFDQSFSITGRELTGFRISKEKIARSRLDLLTVRKKYLLNVAYVYYDLLKSKKWLDIANSNIERLTKHREAAGLRLKVGNATKTALLRAEAELAGAGSELIRAKNDVEIARAVLAGMVGIDGDFDVADDNRRETPDYLTKGCEQETVECLKERALNERAEIRSLAINRSISEDKVRYAKGAYWPTLSLEGVYNREEEEPASTFSLTERIYAGLRLDFPFFEGGLRRTEVREAEARLRQAELILEDFKNTVSVEVERAYLNLMTASGLLTSLKAEVAYAVDNYNAVSKQFEYGLANSIDVMDANTLLVTAERNLANVRYDYHFAVLKLKHAIGVFLKENNAGTTEMPAKD